MASQNRNTGVNAALGTVAGVIGSVVMNQVGTAIYARHGRLTRWRETWARGGTDTHPIAARKLAGVAGVTLDKRQAEILGSAIPFVVATSTAALYGVARPHIPAPAPVRGLAFGAAVWLFGDEVGMVATGVTPGPGAFPWQTHARGLAAHLTFGLVTEGVLSAIDWIRARRETQPVPAR